MLITLASIELAGCWLDEQREEVGPSMGSDPIAALQENVDNLGGSSPRIPQSKDPTFQLKESLS